MKEESSFVASFIEKNGYSPKVLLDLDGKVAKKYDVFGIPVSYLIDKEGNFTLDTDDEITAGTLVTRDGKDSAHFEHTVAVRRDGSDVLTK